MRSHAGALYVTVCRRVLRPPSLPSGWKGVSERVLVNLVGVTMCMVLHRAGMESVVLSNYVTGSVRSEFELVALCRHQPTVLPFPPAAALQWLSKNSP